MTRRKITAFFLSLGLLLGGSSVASATTGVDSTQKMLNVSTTEESDYYYFVLRNLEDFFEKGKLGRKVHYKFINKCWSPVIPGKLPPGKGPKGCWPPL